MGSLACFQNDDTAVVRLLLANNADPNAASKLHGAAKYYSRALAVYHGSQLQKASPWVRIQANWDGFTPLALAAHDGKANTVHALLDARADPDQANWRGVTARSIAESAGFPHLFSESAAAFQTQGSTSSAGGADVVGVVS